MSYKIILIVILFMFIGCGGGSSKSTETNNTPKEDTIVPLEIPSATINPLLINKEK